MNEGFIVSQQSYELVFFFNYSYYINKKTDNMRLSDMFQVPQLFSENPGFETQSCRTKICQCLPAKPAAHTTFHTDGPVQGIHLTFPNGNKLFFLCSELPGHFNLYFHSGSVNSFFVLLKGRRATIS